MNNRLLFIGNELISGLVYMMSYKSPDIAMGDASNEPRIDVPDRRIRDKLTHWSAYGVLKDNGVDTLIVTGSTAQYEK